MTAVTKGLAVAAGLIIGLLLPSTVALDNDTPKQTDAAGGLPYVYTQWKQFTAKDGLPEGHVFAVKADGPRVWVGTEGGLACIDKATGKIQKWTEKDGLPWRVVTGIDVNKKTGEVWLALFGGGLARFSGGRFDHWHQLNSGLVNDVVYAVTIENDNVWAATTAGASRFNTVTGEWTIYTEKNSPMEEIWNYGINYNDGKVYIAIWGSGVLEFDVATQRWKEYVDPDGEMEIELYRDDGIVHVITTGVSYIDKVLWISSYFGVCRYDGRHWRGFFSKEGGLPNEFTNNVKARSGNEAWFCTDKGLGVIADVPSNTWVQYTAGPHPPAGKAVVKRGTDVLETLDLAVGVPHTFIICADIDGNDAWVGTSEGLGWAIGGGYYPGLRDRPVLTTALKKE
jgi:ligand-binding sensor domain-containing protein